MRFVPDLDREQVLGRKSELDRAPGQGRVHLVLVALKADRGRFAHPALG
jgi:hypothetical protein